MFFTNSLFVFSPPKYSSQFWLCSKEQLAFNFSKVVFTLSFCFKVWLYKFLSRLDKGAAKPLALTLVVKPNRLGRDFNNLWEYASLIPLSRICFN